MIKNSYTDLKIVLILTFLSLVFLFIPSLNQYPQNIPCYALLLIVLPGYSLLVTVKPSINQMDIWKRILFSLGLGALLILISYSVWEYTAISAYLTPLINYLKPLESYTASWESYMSFIFIIILLLIIDLTIIAWVRRRAISGTNTEDGGYLYCKSCKRYYKLEKDESLDDFESCQCGGKLVYTGRPEDLKVRKFSPQKVQDGNSVEEPPQNRSLDLLLILIISIIGGVILLEVNDPPYNTIVEFLLILFTPGYALVSAIYPSKEGINSFERVFYAVTFSVALTAATGLILNFTHWKTMIDPILYVLTGLTLIFLLTAYKRRHSIPEEKRYGMNIRYFKGIQKGVSKDNMGEKILTPLLIISAILLLFTTLIVANPLEGKPYTEFSVLNVNGSTVNQINMTSGESGNLTIHIANHENKETTYRLYVTSNGTVQTDKTITLDNKQKVDLNFNFTVGDPGNRTMKFDLYILPDSDEIYKEIKIPLIVTANLTGESSII